MLPLASVNISAEAEAWITWYREACDVMMGIRAPRAWRCSGAVSAVDLQRCAIPPHWQSPA